MGRLSGRSSFLVLLLALRGLVHGVLGLAGTVGLLGGLTCLALALSWGSLVLGLWGLVGFGVWYGAHLSRFAYDSAVLRRAPEGEALFLGW